TKTALILHRFWQVTIMGVPDPGLESYLLSNAHSRGADLITAFSAEQPSDAAAMSARIGTVLDGYCAALLEDLRRAVGQIDAAEAAWLRQASPPANVELCN